MRRTSPGGRTGRPSTGASSPGASRPRPTPTRSSKRRINTTDPDTRLLARAGGGSVQGYNVQVVASPEQVILAAEVTQAHNDSGQLAADGRPGAAEIAAAGIGEPIGTVLADGGYWNARAIAEVREHGIEVLVPTANLRRTAPRTLAAAKARRRDGSRRCWRNPRARRSTGDASRSSSRSSRRRSSSGASTASSAAGCAACHAEWKLIDLNLHGPYGPQGPQPRQGRFRLIAVLARDLTRSRSPSAEAAALTGLARSVAPVLPAQGLPLWPSGQVSQQPPGLLLDPWTFGHLRVGRVPARCCWHEAGFRGAAVARGGSTPWNPPSGGTRISARTRTKGRNMSFKRCIAVGLGVLALGAGASAASAKMIDSSSITGEFTVLNASGTAKHPQLIFVQATSSPHKWVRLNWSLVCDGTKRMGGTTGFSPFKVTLPLPTKRPNKCAVSVSGQIWTGGGGRLTVRIFAR